MATTMTVEFKFEIGDLVYFKSALNNASNRPKPFVITERIGQECHADTQRLYRLHGETNFIPEVALTLEEPAYKPITKEVAIDRAVMLRVERIYASWLRTDEEEKPFDSFDDLVKQVTKEMS